MINIALCDDDILELNNLQTLMDSYIKESNENICTKSFQNALELISEIENGMRYDIIFLDIIMPGINGIDTAFDIRTYDKNVKIIFLTSTDEFAVESYVVGAYYYQLKPIYTESFFRLVESVILACEKEKEESIILKSKDGIVRVNLRNVEYCEIKHRTLFLYLTSGRIIESSGSMDNLSSQLELYGWFVRVHRSYLINLDYVVNITYKAATMSSSAEIPIPRGKYNEIKDKYLEYAFTKQQVII